jgi:hypothetical protein
MPGRKVVAMIVTTPLGVPVILNGAEAVLLNNPSTNDVVALGLEKPLALEEAMQAIKAAVAVIAGLDPMLPDEEWYEEFMSLLYITSFAEPVQVLRHAHHRIADIQKENADVDA